MENAMDKIEIFKGRFEVIPGQDGSFIVAMVDGARMWTGRQWGFSTVHDLMTFLRNHAYNKPNMAQPQQQGNQQGQVAGYAAPITPGDLKNRLLDKHGRPNGPAIALPAPDKAKPVGWFR